MGSSPHHRAATALSKELREEVERRLNQTHSDRITHLTDRLHASMQPPFAKPSSMLPKAHVTTTASAHGRDGMLSGKQQGQRLTEIFDELLASDASRRMAEMAEEVAFRDRELRRLHDALDRTQMEAALAKEQREANAVQLSHAATGTSMLEQELQRARQDAEQLAQQLAAANSCRASAERVAAAAEARAQSFEALAVSKGQDLAELQKHYKGLLQEQQVELDDLQQQLQHAAADRERCANRAATTEQQLSLELHEATAALSEVRSALAGERGAHEALQLQHAQLAEAAGELKRAKKQLVCSLEEAEVQLTESEADRKTLRSKYISLGEKLEQLLQEEAAAKQAAEQSASALKAAVADADKAAVALRQERDALSKQLAEAEAKLVEAAAEQKKAVRKVDKKLVHLAQEYDIARQELMVKTAEILDLQNQVREEALRHDASVSAAEDAAAVLKHQVAMMQNELDASEQRESHAIRQAEARMQLDMRQQQLKYERQIQELELSNRCIAALEAFSDPDMGRRTMDQGAHHSSDPAAAAALNSTGTSSPHRQLLDGFDSRLRRQLAGHAGRVDSLQVAAEQKLVALRKELSSEYTKRLEVLEADWRAKRDAALAEAETSFSLRVQQLELNHRMEREQHEMRITELSATKQRLEESLASLRTEASSSAREAAQLKKECEELKGMVQLQAGRLEEAQRSINALQGLVGLSAPNAAGSGMLGTIRADRDMIAELMARAEARTHERNEAMREAATAEGRLTALEAEKTRLEQRLAQQQQATQAAESARHEMELRAQQAAADQQRLTLALHAAEGGMQQADGKLRQYEEDTRRLSSRLTQAESAHADVQRQLSHSQAEATQLREQVKELRREKQRLEDAAATTEAALKRVSDEKGQLLQVKEELQLRKEALQSQLEEHQDEQRRVSVLVQGLELSKQGLQRRLTWFEGEQRPAGMSLSGVPATARHASPSRLSPRRGSMASPGRASLALLHEEDAGNVEAALARASANFQELEQVVDQFEEERRTLEDKQSRTEEQQRNTEAERRTLAERCEGQASELRELRSQLQRAHARLADQEGSMEQLRAAMDRQAGLHREEVQSKSEHADRVLKDVQRGNVELQQANAQLREDLDAARTAHRQAQQQASIAEQEVAGLQALVMDLQRTLKATEHESQEQAAQRLQQLSQMVDAQLSGLRAKVGGLEEEVRQEVAHAAQECIGQVKEVEASWRAKLEALEATHTADMQAQLTKHQEAMTQLGQQLAFAADEASSLRATQGRVQGQLLALRVHMGELLELQGAADAAAAVASSSAAAADAEVEALAADVRGALLAVLQQEVALAQEREGLLLERESLLQEREGLLLQCSALSGDLQACATNLQSMVSVVAFSVPLEAELQQGLNAKDQAVFDANLQQLHEAITDHVEAQRRDASQESEVQLQTGAIAELKEQTQTLQEEIAEREHEVATLKADAEAAMIKYEDRLVKCRVECMEAAEAARQEAMGALKAEVTALKGQLQELQDAHATELTAQQEASGKQLQQHVKTADRIIRELEGTATSLQAQLAAEVERADGMAAQLKSLQSEQERKQAAEARKERRQTGEIDTLRTRLREMEARQAEKEDELKALKRSLRQKELSLLGGNGVAVDR